MNKLEQEIQFKKNGSGYNIGEAKAFREGALHPMGSRTRRKR